MQVEDLIIKELRRKNKTKKVVLFEPIDKQDDRKKLVVTRPNDTSILASEVYDDTKNPSDKTQVVKAIKNLEAQGRIKSIQTKRSGEMFHWIELV
jgi:hypothetical protein